MQISFLGFRIARAPGSKTKLIRRLGHFKMRINGEHIGCRRYFYDAQHCLGELTAELHVRHLDRLGGPGGTPRVLWEKPVSDWLRDSLIMLENRGVSLVDTRECLGQAEDYREGESGLLVVPAMYSGRSLARLLEQLTVRHPKLKLNALSVLSQQGDKDGTRTIMVSEQQWRIPFLLKVEQRTFSPSQCLMCKLGLPETEPSPGDETAMLSTYDMWDMVSESGWKDEEDVPGHRKSLGKVPKLPEIIEQHGAWLASKFRMVLKTAGTSRRRILSSFAQTKKGRRLSRISSGRSLASL